MATTAEIVAALERLDSEEAPLSRLDEELSSIHDVNELWHIADQVFASIRIMRVIYRRALALGGSEEHAVGYLAMGHYLLGDFDTASALTAPFASESRSPVLLNVWALLPEHPQERLRRLRAATKQCPDERLFRSMADVARQEAAVEDARRAIRWLIEHEKDPSELSRLAVAYKEL